MNEPIQRTNNRSQIATLEPLDIQSKIYTVRGVQVMIDSDLATLYGVDIKRLNEQVKRNIARFPDHFRFQLTVDENAFLERTLVSQNVIPNEDISLRSQIATLETGRGKHRKYIPYVFTEQGVSMLSAVLHSELAIRVSIQIIDAFVEMRKFIANNAGIFQRLDRIERRQIETDSKFEEVFQALEAKSITPTEGIFFDGQIYDAYSFACDLIRSAKKSILLIDNYVDDTVLTLLSKRTDGVTARILTQSISKQLELDLEKHNSQYPPVKIAVLKKSHDRFLILDDTELYHFGASLKDLGKKWFAFSKMEDREVLGKLLEVVR